jgi:hypothetical protein
VRDEVDLIARAGPAQPPNEPVAEVPHLGAAGEALDPSPPDGVPDLGRGDAVGAADHRRQQGSIAERQSMVGAHPQVGREQHHLEDAGGRGGAGGVVAGEAPTLVDHREGDLALPPVRVTPCGGDVGTPRNGACGARRGQGGYRGQRAQRRENSALMAAT